MTTNIEKQKMPGGLLDEDIFVAVILAGYQYSAEIWFGDLFAKVFEKFLHEMTSKYPGKDIGNLTLEAFDLRYEELRNERKNLLNSHLRPVWFFVAYYAWILIAWRSKFIDEIPGPIEDILPYFTRHLLELGIESSVDECLVEIDNCLPESTNMRNLAVATFTYLDRLRYMHRAALRHRQVVTSGFIETGVGIAYVEEDAKKVNDISRFIQSHGIYICHNTEDAEQHDRAIVIVTENSIHSDKFWRDLESWQIKGMQSLVVLFISRKEFISCSGKYKQKYETVYNWLRKNVAIEIAADNPSTMYVPIIRALDRVAPEQWWWHDDSMTLGLSVNIFGVIDPPPTKIRPQGKLTGIPYPIKFPEDITQICYIASNHYSEYLTSESEIITSAPIHNKQYTDIRNDAQNVRGSLNDDPYLCAWFVVGYQSWFLILVELMNLKANPTDIAFSVRDMQHALYALGIGTGPYDVDNFLREFMRLPWKKSDASIASIDERALAFIELVRSLSNKAIARCQRISLRFPLKSCFVSYSRNDETIAKALVDNIEQKNIIDLWWDIDSISLGEDLSETLIAAISRSDCFIVLMSNTAAESAYVCLELKQAIACNREIIPIVLEERIPGTFVDILNAAPKTVDIKTPIYLSQMEPDTLVTKVLPVLERNNVDRINWIKRSDGEFNDLLLTLTRARDVIERNKKNETGIYDN